MIRFSDDLRIWRATYRLSQQAAGDMLGVSGKTVARWEREDSRPSEDHYNSVRWLISQPPPGWVRE
jgi:DNA-binding transcriptional regulator YiaG